MAAEFENLNLHGFSAMQSLIFWFVLTTFGKVLATGIICFGLHLTLFSGSFGSGGFFSDSGAQFLFGFFALLFLVSSSVFPILGFAFEATLALCRFLLSQNSVLLEGIEIPATGLAVFFSSPSVSVLWFRQRAQVLSPLLGRNFDPSRGVKGFAFGFFLAGCFFPMYLCLGNSMSPLSSGQAFPSTTCLVSFSLEETSNVSTPGCFYLSESIVLNVSSAAFVDGTLCGAAFVSASPSPYYCPALVAPQSANRYSIAVRAKVIPDSAVASKSTLSPGELAVSAGRTGHFAVVPRDRFGNAISSLEGSAALTGGSFDKRLYSGTAETTNAARAGVLCTGSCGVVYSSRDYLKNSFKTTPGKTHTVTAMGADYQSGVFVSASPSPHYRLAFAAPQSANRYSIAVRVNDNLVSFGSGFVNVIPDTAVASKSTLSPGELIVSAGSTRNFTVVPRDRFGSAISSLEGPVALNGGSFDKRLSSRTAETTNAARVGLLCTGSCGVVYSNRDYLTYSFKTTPGKTYTVAAMVADVLNNRLYLAGKDYNLPTQLTGVTGWTTLKWSFQATSSLNAVYFQQYNSANCGTHCTRGCAADVATFGDSVVVAEAGTQFASTLAAAPAGVLASTLQHSVTISAGTIQGAFVGQTAGAYTVSLAGSALQPKVSVTVTSGSLVASMCKVFGTGLLPKRAAGTSGQLAVAGYDAFGNAASLTGGLTYSLAGPSTLSSPFTSGGATLTPTVTGVYTLEVFLDSVPIPLGAFPASISVSPAASSAVKSEISTEYVVCGTGFDSLPLQCGRGYLISSHTGVLGIGQKADLVHMWMDGRKASMPKLPGASRNAEGKNKLLCENNTLTLSIHMHKAQPTQHTPSRLRVPQHAHVRTAPRLGAGGGEGGQCAFPTSYARGGHTYLSLVKRMCPWVRPSRCTPPPRLGAGHIAVGFWT